MTPLILQNSSGSEYFLFMDPFGSDQSRHVDDLGAKIRNVDDILAKISSFQ